VREFPLTTGEADYLLFVHRKAIGAVEAKPEGDTLSGVELQSGKYSVGLPAQLPAWVRPLPFLYESTGVEAFSPAASIRSHGAAGCSHFIGRRRWRNGPPTASDLFVPVCNGCLR